MFFAVLNTTDAQLLMYEVGTGFYSRRPEADQRWRAAMACYRSKIH